MAAPDKVLILDNDTFDTVLTLDASISERHSADVEATSHPVEQGAAITDHLRPLPQMLVIEGIVSNTPARAAAAGEQFPSNFPGAAEAAFGILEGRRKAGLLHTVHTTLKDYGNMALISRPVLRDARNGDALSVTLTFKEILVVQNQSLTIQTATPQGQPKKPLASRPSPSATPTGDTNTVAKSLTDALGITSAGSGL